MSSFKPDYNVSPGEVLYDIIEGRDINPNVLADDLNVSYGYLNSIIDGKTEITEDMADKLEKALGIKAHIWINLENTYRKNIK